MDARFRVLTIERYERAVRFRAPFRFGASTITGAPQAFVRARIEFPDGATEAGAAAEMMMPKWFDKSPDRSESDNIVDLRRALVSAADAYSSDHRHRTAFGHHAAHARALEMASEARGSNALTALFGASLVDRALLDASCRRLRIPFVEAMRANMPGIEAEAIAPDLAGFDIAGFLSARTARNRVALRHTIGLADPLEAREMARPSHHAPCTLEDVIAIHRPRCFKLKLSGNVAADLNRIARVARVLDRALESYRVTLDGNEQFHAVEDAVELWRAIDRDPRLSRFAASVLWIEQPLARETTRRASVHALAAFKPLLIDESDATPDAFPRARSLGYTGVSSKSCKGIYKSVVNAGRCAQWNAQAGEERFFLSAEDLTTQAGISLQQDLALAGFLGIEHVERNGHHYVDGFEGEGATEIEARSFLAAHGDLYEASNGSARVSIHDGTLRFASLEVPGYASAAEPDWSTLAPIGSAVVSESP